MRAGLLKFLYCVMAYQFALTSPVSQADEWQDKRKTMIREIRADVRATASHINRRALAPEVMQAMSEVPRHLFVPQPLRTSAYFNRPLPIGYGQTISQPYIVALMSDLVEPKAHHRVLEVGTGSGYQASILSRLVAQVYSIEIIPQLAERAREVIKDLEYDNINLKVGDGYYGWEEHAPFDAIVVTAAADHIPPPLVQQLSVGGRMVIPVGDRFTVQELLLVSKDSEGKPSIRKMLPVRFVPLTGSH